MRNHVPFLDTNAMSWQQGQMTGQFTKLLSSDPETGERTALQRIDPTSGYGAPGKPHYHPTTDEELYVIKGRFSFDSENWLGPGSYCFHPRNTVHGFKSAVAEESWFLSRIQQHLVFGFVEDEPKKLEPYPLDGVEAPRPVRVVVDPAKLEWNDVRDDAGRLLMQRSSLGEHPDTGEGSMLVRFMPGWESAGDERVENGYAEFYVVEGELVADDGTKFGPGCYAYKPVGTTQSRLTSPRGALAYVNYGGPLGFLADRDQSART